MTATTSPRPVRLRVAPSPTGDPHVGTAYVSLFDLAFVRQQGGQFILRIEDTDQARFRPDSEQQIFDMLHWLGLNWDEGPDIGGPFAPYRQSERLDHYTPYVDRLLERGHAYYCWCSTERLAQMREAQQKSKQPTGYDRLCYGKTEQERSALPGFSQIPVVRMLIPAELDTRFTDLIRGELNAPYPDDQVIVKADGFPTYHLAVVVDDHEMGITHVVRGEEWISSTPKHVLLYQWLGLEQPAFAHMPLLRNFDESVADFDWAKVNPVGPIFDLDKLGWLNGHYIRSLDTDELANRIVGHLTMTGVLDADPKPAQVELIRAATPLVQERMQLLSEAEGMLTFLLVRDSDLVVADDARAQLKGEPAAVLDVAVPALEALPRWVAGDIEAALRAALVDGLGIKAKFAFTPLRVGVTGRRISPPLFESMEILGRESSLTRLRSLRASLCDVRKAGDH